MLLLFQFPEIFEPKTWPWPMWLVVTFGALWFLKQLAEAVSSIKTLKESGVGVWGWVKGVFISARVRAAQERQELKSTVVSLGDRFSAIEKQNVEILREVKPNGGSSLNDRVCSMGDVLDNIATKVEATAAWVHHEKETSDKPTFIMDADGNMTFVNCAFRELVNAEEAELLELKYLSRIEAGDQKRLKDEIDFAIRNKIPFDTSVNFKKDDGVFVPVRLQASVDVNGNRTLKNFFGRASVVDAADRHLSQG